MKWVIGVKKEISEILPTLDGLWATNDGNQNIQVSCMWLYFLCSCYPRYSRLSRGLVWLQHFCSKSFLYAEASQVGDASSDPEIVSLEGGTFISHPLSNLFSQVITFVYQSCWDIG